MASLVVRILKGLVTGIILFVFVTAGMMKLTGRFSPKMHEEMVSLFLIVRA